MAIQVMTTIDAAARAEELAAVILEQRLAACCQIIGPVTSMYWWQGKLDRAEEWLLVFKSSDELYPALEQAIRARHPYECPEILATEVKHGFQGYLDWLAGNVRKADD